MLLPASLIHKLAPAQGGKVQATNRGVSLEDAECSQVIGRGMGHQCQNPLELGKAQKQTKSQPIALDWIGESLSSFRLAG